VTTALALIDTNMRKCGLSKNGRAVAIE